jgi:hypothetical protein
MKRLVRRKSDGRIVEQYAKSTKKYFGVVFAPVFEGWEIVDLRELYDPATEFKPTSEYLDKYYAGELD